MTEWCGWPVVDEQTSWEDAQQILTEAELSDGLPLGCVGLKGTGKQWAEIKRLWVSPAARGLGVARRLMDAAEATARELSIPVLRLDTNRALPEAMQLYRASGWTEIPRFNDDPYPDTFFEKRL